jgi:hypothetical protein
MKKFKCRVCGEMVEEVKLVQHAITKHKDLMALDILADIKRLTDPKNRSYGQVVDELGVKWLVIGRDMLDKVMIRSDLKVMHVWIDGGGMFEIETTSIKSRIGVKAEIEEVDPKSRSRSKSD